MPDYPDIQAIKERLQDDWSQRDTLIAELRALRFMEHTVEVPTTMEAEKVKIPDGHQMTERMVGTLTADAPTITIPPASEKADAEEQASRMEKFILPALDQLERQADSDVIDKFVETLIADGHGCMRMLYAPQLWHGFPRRRRKQKETDGDYDDRTEVWKRGKSLPIAWNWLDPLTVYPMWSEFGLEGILEVDERDVLTLRTDRWNVQKPDLGELSRLSGKGGGSVEFAQWWTPGTLTYAVEGEVVHHQKHNYGTPPYSYALGLGAAINEPGKIGYGVLYPVRDVIPARDRVLSQKLTSIRIWCWPTIVFKQTSMGQALTPDESGSLPERHIEIAPGLPVTLYQDEEISFLTWQGNGPDADEALQFLMGIIERAGLSESMYGRSVGDSGYAINQLIAAARMRYKPIIAHAERALEQQVARLFDIIEHQIKQTVHVYAYGKGQGWISLGPDDLKGYRQVRVKLNPLMPTDTYARSSQALNEVTGGIRSRYGAMEMIGIQQPEEEMRRILLDKWKERPEVEEFLTREAIKKAGLKLAEGELSAGALGRALPALPPALVKLLTEQAEAQVAVPPSPPGGPGAVPTTPGLPPQRPVGAPLGTAGPPMGAPPSRPSMGGPQPPLVAQQGMGAPMGAPTGAPAGAPPMAGPPPGPAQPGMDVMAQVPPQLVPVVQQIAQMLGVPVEMLVQKLLQIAQQNGVPLEVVIQGMLEWIQSQAGAGGVPGGGAPPAAGQGPPGPGRLGSRFTGAQQPVMAAPGVRAAPVPPPAPRHVGPITRPAGVAGGRAPGTRRRGSE